MCVCVGVRGGIGELENRVLPSFFDEMMES